MLGMIFPHAFVNVPACIWFHALVRGKNGILDGKTALENACTNIAIYHIHREIISVETFQISNNPLVQML